MKLILMRHSIAAEPRTGESDHERTLTTAGVIRAQKAGRLMAEAGFVPGLIASSPLVRTCQTAKAVGEQFPDVELEQWPELGPDLDLFAELKSLLSELVTGEGTLVLITHQPAVSFLALLLAKSRHDVPQGFDPGVFVVFELSSWIQRGATVLDVAKSDRIDGVKL